MGERWLTKRDVGEPEGQEGLKARGLNEDVKRSAARWEQRALLFTILRLQREAAVGI